MIVTIKLIALLVALTLADPATSPATMTAVRVHEPGGREVLKVEQVPRPSPAEGQILVRVHAAAINPVDWKMRKGFGRGRTRGSGADGFILGFDVSGVVEQVGPGVTKFKPGDAVFAMLSLQRGGGYAEYAIVKEDEAAMKPEKASHVEAAAVPLAALTAWQALFDTAHLEKGQTVLIHAGAGGVGHFAVQLAKWKGAKVIATASNDNLDFLRQLGADEVIDYRNQKFEDVAKDVDVVLDSIGGDTQARSFSVLKKGGTLVSIVGPPPQDKATAAGVRAAGILVKPNADELSQIGKLIDVGQVKAVVSKTFPLSEVAKAHEVSETGHARGKIVLQVAPAP
jgi:NADPH:quinone reductase-like Zn-dependent oxidoreductase